MNCPTCGQSVDDLATKLDVADKWWILEGTSKGRTYFVSEVGTATMISPPADAEYDSYGSTTSEDIFMVVEVDGRYFKKEGARSSYGGTEWDGECREVKAEPRTVTVYDYA